MSCDRAWSVRATARRGKWVAIVCTYFLLANRHHRILWRRGGRLLPGSLPQRRVPRLEQCAGVHSWHGGQVRRWRAALASCAPANVWLLRSSAFSPTQPVCCARLHSSSTASSSAPPPCLQLRKLVWRSGHRDTNTRCVCLELPRLHGGGGTTLWQKIGSKRGGEGPR